MKRYLIILLLNLIGVAIGFAAQPENKVGPEAYLDEIIRSHLKDANENKYTYEDYLELTKPYGMWDVRPRNEKGIKIGDRVAKPGEVSHYHFGIFSAYYKIQPDQVEKPLNEFLMRVEQKKPIYKESALRYANQLLDIVSNVVHSGHTVFISHDKYQRVDDIFLEKSKYWKYEIDQNSPFALSGKKVYLEKTSFSEDDKVILKALKTLGLYGAVRTNTAIFVMVDGMLNYSYGYMFSPLDPKSIHPGPLFEIQTLEKVDKNIQIYFYMAN